MLRNLFLLCVLSALMASSAVAQTVVPPEALAVMEPYVGGTWVSERSGRDGATIRTERTYAWTLAGRFLEVREKSESGARTSHYLAILGPDPATKQLTAWSFTSAGQLFFMRRVSSGEAGADALVFESFGEGQLYRMTVRRTDRDRFEEVTEVQREGAWVPAGQQIFIRAR